MHAQVIAGVLASGVISYLVIFGYCVSAEARSSQDAGNRVFGLFTFSLAVYSAGAALYYASGDRDTTVRGLLVATIGRVGAAAFLLHLIAIEAESPSAGGALPPAHKRKLAVLYCVAATLAIATATRAATVVAPEPYAIDVLGVMRLRELVLPTTMIDVAIAIFSTGVVAACLAGSVRALRDEREGIPMVVGAALLVLASAHDSARDLGFLRGPMLTPFGYWLLVMCAVLTRLARFSTLRAELEARTIALKRQSRKLLRSNEELRTTQSELVRKEQLAAVGELSAVIAHEVRNPLAIIANAVATLRRTELDENDKTTLLAILEEESSRLNHLVGDLLSYARPLAIEQNLVALPDVVNRATALARGHATIQLETSIAESVEPVHGDAGLLRQLVENLVTNAMQAMASGGKMTVRLAPGELDAVSGCALEVEDTGEGMDTQVRSRALDPFFTTRPSGTGLGLAIVARIVDAHGGTLRIKSSAGVGTVMNVFLPYDGEAITSARRAATEARRGSSPSLPIESEQAMNAEPR